MHLFRLSDNEHHTHGSQTAASSSDDFGGSIRREPLKNQPDVPAWAAAVIRVLGEPAFAPSRDSRLSQAARYSWREHARVIAETYLNLFAGGR